MDELRRELSHAILMLVRSGGEVVDVEYTLSVLDAYIEAKLKEVT